MAQMDPIAVIDQAAAHTRKYIAGVKPNQMNDSTPCEKWNVKQLLDHITGVPLFGLKVFGGTPGSGELHDATKGGTTVDAFNRNLNQFIGELKKPGALQKTVKPFGGDMPGAAFAMILADDILIHGWDLAKATKQDTKLPANLVEACYAAMSPGFANLSKAPGEAFKPMVQVPANADLQTKLLAGLGRKA